MDKEDLYIVKSVTVGVLVSNIACLLVWRKLWDCLVIIWLVDALAACLLILFIVVRQVGVLASGEELKPLYPKDGLPVLAEIQESGHTYYNVLVFREQTQSWEGRYLSPNAKIVRWEYVSDVFKP